MNTISDMNAQLRTRPLMPKFGVEILDVDVTRADAKTLSEVIDIFHRNGAIVVRGSAMTPAQQLAFTHLFGEPEANARQEYTDPDHPEVYFISNKVVDGRRIGDPDAGQGWHTDFSYGKYPAMCTILHAIEVPPEGSDTLLADLCAAWNALPKERQEKLDGLVIHHSFAHLQARRNAPMTEEQIRLYPDVWHPMIRRHPADGRKALWVSTGTVKGIVGMPEADGVSLVDELVDFAVQEQFVYRHKWQVGDTLVWDNRCTLHRGTPFDKDKHIRHVQRTWVKGEVPV